MKDYYILVPEDKKMKKKEIMLMTKDSELVMKLKNVTEYENHYEAACGNTIFIMKKKDVVFIQVIDKKGLKLKQGLEPERFDYPYPIFKRKTKK